MYRVDNLSTCIARLASMRTTYKHTLALDSTVQCVPYILTSMWHAERRQHIHRHRRGLSRVHGCWRYSPLRSGIGI